MCFMWSNEVVVKLSGHISFLLPVDICVSVILLNLSFVVMLWMLKIASVYLSLLDFLSYRMVTNSHRSPFKSVKKIFGVEFKSSLQ